MATINGTPDNDTLNGTLGADTINGLGGRDEPNGAEDDDVLNGGTGNDALKLDSAGTAGRAASPLLRATVTKAVVTQSDIIVTWHNDGGISLGRWRG